MTTCARKKEKNVYGVVVIGPLVEATTDGEVVIRTKEDHPREMHFYADGVIHEIVADKGIDRTFSDMQEVLCVNKMMRDMVCHELVGQNTLTYESWLDKYGPVDPPERPKYARDPAVNKITEWAIYYARKLVAAQHSQDSGQTFSTTMMKQIT